MAHSLLDPSLADARTEWLTARLSRLALPTLLVRGELSDIVTEDIAIEFRRLVPGAAVAEIASAAHMVAGDSNDRFTEVIRHFLAALVAEGPLPYG
jgi:pimeloyl-ACP methyl ester carboxylesterase